jgi:hypothetical protein
MSLNKELCKILNRKINLSSGHNGPYKEEETVIRNASHYVVLLVNVLLNDLCRNSEQLEKNIYEIIDLFESNQFRPCKKTFQHLVSPKGKDRSNGLIGQAWTLEALKALYEYTSNEKYLETGRELILLHPFNEKHALWHIVDIDGKKLPMDGTFNHQLWFAASAFMFVQSKDDPISCMVNKFFDSLGQNLNILNNGLIFHAVPSIKKDVLHRFGGVIKHLRYGSFFHRIKKKQTVYNGKVHNAHDKRIGYHAFNMYAFALLKMNGFYHPFFETVKFQKAVNFMLSEEYKDELTNNIYGYGYNPPGFEVPVSLCYLTNLNEKDLLYECNYWINWQFKKTYDPDLKMMANNNPDSETLTARLYEISRLKPDILKQIHLEI